MDNALECSLWEEWVLHLCQREEMALPTHDEWRMLRGRWYPGKAPIETIDDLRLIRKEK